VRPLYSAPLPHYLYRQAQHDPLDDDAHQRERERGLERERDDGRAERRGNVERETAAGYKNETEMIHPSIHGAANLNWVGAPRKKREASEPGRTATGS